MPVILAAILAAFEAPISAQRMGNKESNWVSASTISILSFAEINITNSPFWWFRSVVRYLIRFEIESV